MATAPVRARVVQRISTNEIGDGVGRVLRLVAVADGGVVLLDASPATAPLLVLDAKGTVVRALGRYGEGPGEFSSAAYAVVDRQGQVTLVDPTLRRLTRWDATDRVIDSRGLAAIGLPERSGGIALRADGCLNVGERLAPQNAGAASLWLIGPRRYHRYCPATGGITLPSSERALPPIHARAPFGYATYRVPLVDGRIVTVSSDALGFSWHDAQGRVRGVRLPATAPAVSAAERAELAAVDTYIAEHFPRVFQPPRGPLPARKQVVVDAMSDPTGLVWLARSGPGVRGTPQPAVRIPGGPSPPMLHYREPLLFSVFRADGAYLGDVHFPDEVDHLVFAGRVAWGVMEDHDGVEVLVRFDVTLREAL